MEEFYVPTGAGEAEFVEKRSRFIGRIFLCEDEAHALSELERIRKQHWDATHNVYAYIIHDGPTRYSDDGEPGGTAGMPVLEVLRREKLENVLCVVTRYFGGTLLGAGGLVRAYAKSAKLGVDAAGISVKRIWQALDIPCPYNLFERVRQETAAFGGIVADVEYGADVCLRCLFPKEQTAGFLRRLTDLSSGSITPVPGPEEYRAVPLEK